MITRKQLDKMLADAKKEAVKEVQAWVNDLLGKVEYLSTELKKAEVWKEKAQMHEAAYLNTKAALDQFQFFADETNKATIQKDKSIDKLATGLIDYAKITEKVVAYFIDISTPEKIVVNQEPVAFTDQVNDSGKTLAEHIANIDGKKGEKNNQ